MYQPYLLLQPQIERGLRAESEIQRGLWQLKIVHFHMQRFSYLSEFSTES